MRSMPGARPFAARCKQALPPPSPPTNPFGPSPSPAPPSAGDTNSNLQAIVPVVTQVSSSVDHSHTTVRLTVKLSAVAKNVYTMYGAEGLTMSIPAAYQVAEPFGANIGGTNAQFAQFKPESKFDSWLTLGVTTGSGTAIGSVGIPWKQWTGTSGFSTTNGAIFYMNPNHGPTARSVVVAQLTYKKGVHSKFVANFAGQLTHSTHGDGNYHEKAVTWMLH